MRALKNRKQVNQETIEENKKLEEWNKSLYKENKELQEQYKDYSDKANTAKSDFLIKLKEKQVLENTIKIYNSQKDEIYADTERMRQHIDQELAEYRSKNEELEQTKLDQFRQEIKQKIEKAEQELKYKTTQADQELQQFYLDTQQEYSSDLAELLEYSQEELYKLNRQITESRLTYQAMIEARLREKKIKDEKKFYCLQINEVDKNDIKILNNMKQQLTKPRALSMVIWSTYYQKPLKTLSNNILGAKEVCGIYKITNTETNECYIGQAKDVAKRWSEHAKFGLGIDTPAGNKLYKAMEEYGLESFSWELLEECKPGDLNAKESFYIDLYDSYNFGYNSNKGITKG